MSRQATVMKTTNMEESTLAKIETGSESDVTEFLIEFNIKHAQSFSFPDLSLQAKKKIVEVIFEHLGGNQNCSLQCLETVRILSREKMNLDELFSVQKIKTLMNLAGLVTEEEEIVNQCNAKNGSKIMLEAQKCLCNLIYNSPTVQKMCCDNGCVEGIMLRLRIYKDPGLHHEVKFFDMRMLFLLTALCAATRPKLRTQLHGLTYLMEVLDLILKDNAELIAKNNTGNRKKFSKGSRKGRNARSDIEINFIPCLDDKEVEMACEVLKVLYNLTVNTDKYHLEEEEDAHYMRLVSILHDILLSDTKVPEKKDELQSHTIDLLTNMPASSYEELLTPVTESPGGKKDSSRKSSDPLEFDGMNMEAVNVLLEFLERRLDKPNKTYKEILSPILTTLGEASRSNSTIRKYLRAKVLPPLRDVMNRPEEGSTLRNSSAAHKDFQWLVKLMTSPCFDLKELVADFLFVLCKENVLRLIKYTGYGNAAGLLASRGLMLGGRGRGNYSSDSEDSDTEEYLQYKDKINPILGCYQEPSPNPMEGMSEEQKEYEAMQLVNMMDKLARDGLVQPMRVGDDGKPYAVSHILELQRGTGIKPKPAEDSD